jgi:hypothetical protein
MSEDRVDPTLQSTMMTDIAADLIKRAYEIDGRTGPIPGRTADAIARQLRAAAFQIKVGERALLALVAIRKLPGHEEMTDELFVRRSLTIIREILDPTAEPLPKAPEP